MDSFTYPPADNSQHPLNTITFRISLHSETLEGFNSMLIVFMDKQEIKQTI